MSPTERILVKLESWLIKYFNWNKNPFHITIFNFFIFEKFKNYE